MKILLTFALCLCAFVAHAANPSTKSFRGAGGITILSNDVTGLIVVDGSGVVATGTNSSIRTSTNGTTMTAGATNINYMAGNNVVLKGTNIGSTTHLDIGTKSNLSFYGTGSEMVIGNWGGQFGISNATLGELGFWVEDPTSDTEFHFGGNVIAGGIVVATNVQLTAIPGTGTNVGITAGGTLFRTTVTGGSSGTGNGTLTSTNLQPVLVVVDGDSQSTTNFSGYGQAWSDYLKKLQPWTNFTFTNLAANFRTSSNNVLNWQTRGGALSILTNLAPHSAVWFGWFGYADVISLHAPVDIINNLSNGMVLARRAGFEVVVPTVQQGGGSAYPTNSPPNPVTTNRWTVNNWLRTTARTNQLYDYLIDIETIFSNSVPQYSENQLGYVYDLFSTNYNPSPDLTISDETHWNALAQSIVAAHIASNVLRWATQPLGVHGGTIRGTTGLTIEDLPGSGTMVAATTSGRLVRTNSVVGNSFDNTLLAIISNACATVVTVSKGANVTITTNSVPGHTDYEVASTGGGSGTPGGSTFSVQWNTNSTFAGDSFLQYIPAVAAGGDGIARFVITDGSRTNMMRDIGFGTVTADDLYLFAQNTARVRLSTAGHFGPIPFLSSSNAYSLGFYNFPWSTGYIQQVETKGVNISGTGSGMASFSDAAGLISGFGGMTMVRGVTNLPWTDTNAGVVTTYRTAAGVNQLTNIALAAGQVVTGNGSGGYAAASIGDIPSRQHQIANVAQLTKFPLSVPVYQFSNSWTNFSFAAPGYEDARLTRDWSRSRIDGTIYNSASATPAAGTILYLPWGFRGDNHGSTFGSYNYFNGTAYAANGWVMGGAEIQTIGAWAGTSTFAGMKLDYGSTCFYYPIAHPTDTNLVLMVPPNCTNATTLVVFFHGGGESQFALINYRAEDQVTADSNWVVTAKAILTNGWPILSHRAQETATFRNFGNAAALNDYSNSVVWATNSLITTNVVFVAYSMGGLSALSLYNQMTSVSKLYMVSALTSLSNIYYFDTPGGSSNLLNTTYSTTAATFNADTAAFDPLRLATNAYGGRLVRFAASAADTTVPTNYHAYAWTNKFYTSAYSVTNSTGQHATSGNVIAADIIQFLKQ